MKFKLLRFIIMTFKFSTYVFVLQAIFMVNIMAFDSNAQYKSVKKAEIEVEFNNNTVSEVFAEIQEKTSYRFYYNKADLKRGIKVDLQPGSYMVSEILMKVSEEAGLKFRQVNNSIAVSKMTENELAKNEPVHVIVEDVTVSGKVVDSDGSPLPGASVVIKQTGQGTVTDIDGNYKLTVAEDATLVYSYVGYESYEVPVGGRSTIDVTLVEDLETLKEVVVVGYSTIDRQDLTGSIATVKNKDFNVQPGSQSVDQMLGGQLAGVAVSKRAADQVQDPLSI